MSTEWDPYPTSDEKPTVNYVHVVEPPTCGNCKKNHGCSELDDCFPNVCGLYIPRPEPVAKTVTNVPESKDGVYHFVPSRNPIKPWWPGYPEVEPYMIPVNEALDRSGLVGQVRTDVYNRAYEAVYKAIQNSKVVTVREE